jgi:PAS domain S-box-containing protein
MTLRTKALIVLSVPLVPLLLSATAIIITARQQRAAQQWVSHTLDVKAQVAAVLQQTIDAEASIEDYWLSRDPQALTRFQNLATAWPPVIQGLLGAVADSPEQTEHALRVRTLRRGRPLGALRDYVLEHPESVRPPADVLTHSHELLASIRTELDAMQTNEDQLLTTRVASLRLAEARMLRAAFWGALLGLAGGLAGALAFSKEISRRIHEVRENSERLLRHEPLQHVRPSRDELGMLDDYLQQAWGMTAEHIVAIDRARAQLDQFFSVSLDMLCIAGLDGRFKRLNPAWEQTLGWSTEQLMSVPFIEFVHPDDVELTLGAAPHQAERSTIVEMENRYRCQDGSYRWLNWKTVSRPEVGLIFAAVRDVTEQKRTDAELRQRVSELKELNGELEAFSYSVSHDLRAPLRHVTGFSAFLERSAAPKLNAQERRWLSLSLAAGQRMGRLIDDLLDFSKMGRVPVTRTVVHLSDLVNEAREEVSGGSVTSPPVQWCIEPLPDVSGDAAMLRLAFVNLLGNAVKYSQHADQPRVDVGVLAGDSRETIIFVRDNGVGFDMQYAHKLFGVFQRLHDIEEFEGTGIGLANVRRIVTRHGGRVWAEGVVNGGATFYVSLPAISGGSLS